MKKVLEMEKITKQFPGVKALDGVDFSLYEGEIHGLIGENGAGKSTLMNVLMGLYKPDRGEIRFAGEVCEITSPAHAISKGVGMVPQELNLNPYVDAAENIFLGNEIKNRFGMIQWSKMRQKAAEILQTLGVELDITLPVCRHTIANQQMIQLARALASGANILIFDEPTASLTVTETQKLLKLMRQLRDSGKSLIFITHRLDELLEVTDRITVMRDGRLVDVQPTDKLTKDQLIEKMAGRKIEMLKRQNRVLRDEVVLKVEHLSRNAEFEDISFEVRRGEIFGIGGLIGSKRTELMSTVFGITEKHSGQIYYEGKPVEITSPDVAIRLGMGYVPEERRKDGIFPILSVKENMVLPVYRELYNHLTIQEPLMQEIRYLDKLIDELAKGKSMEKILRKEL